MSNFNPHARIVPAEFDDGWVLEIDGEIQSHVDLDQPELIRFEYLRRIGNVLDLCWPPTQPLRVLHLGAGALTLARYTQATRPSSTQTVIELDPQLVDLVITELPLPTGTVLHVVAGDARAKLQALSEPSFDVIIVDIFTGHDTADHLAETGFYQEVLQRLSDAGIVLVNAGDDEGLGFFGQQARRLHQVAREAGLSGAWVLADASTLNRRLAGNAVLAAGPGLPMESHEAATLRSRLTAAGPHPGEVLSPDETAALIKNLGG